LHQLMIKKYRKWGEGGTISSSLGHTMVFITSV